MADPSRSPATTDDTGTPRWVKVSGIIGIVLVGLVVLVMFVGGGEHGPNRHTSLSGTGGQIPPSGVTAFSGPGNHTPPAGGH